MKIHDFNIKFSRVFVISLIIFISTTLVVHALDSQPFTINMGVYPGASSFTVWEQDGDYYAKNPFGVIVYTGTDFKTIFEDVEADDTTIMIAPGTYLVDSDQGVIIQEINNLMIYGYGAIIFNDYTGQQEQLFHVNYSSNIYVYGLTFDQDRGNPDHTLSASYGIQWNLKTGHSENVYFTDCQILRSIGCGYVSGYSNNVNFVNCVFDESSEHPIYVNDDENINFLNCWIGNWAQDHRGWIKVNTATDVAFTNCIMLIQDDGHTPSSVGGGSYLMDVYGSNNTIIENCVIYDQWNALWVEANSHNTQIKSNNFTYPLAGAETYVVINDDGNHTIISDNRFYHYHYRIVDCIGGSDAYVNGNYFSGGVTSWTIAFGYRTAVISNYWVPNTERGNYALGSSSGTGIFALNQMCNNTLTFTIPAGVYEFGNTGY